MTLMLLRIPGFPAFRDMGRTAPTSLPDSTVVKRRNPVRSTLFKFLPVACHGCLRFLTSRWSDSTPEIHHLI